MNKELLIAKNTFSVHDNLKNALIASQIITVHKMLYFRKLVVRARREAPSENTIGQVIFG